MSIDLNWNSLLEQRNLLPAGAFVKNTHVNCPFCGKKKFRLWQQKGNGFWICTCGSGNGLNLYAKLSGQSEGDVLRQIRTGKFTEFGSGGRIAAPVVRSLSEDEIKQNKERLSFIRRKCVAVKPNDPVWRYLESRVSFLDIGKLSTKSIFFHPRLQHLSTDAESGEVVKTYHPAMILVVRGTNGAVTLHRTYLNHKGGKAQVEEPKKLCSGIELLNGHYVDVCEGIENCRIIAVGEGFETMAGVSIAHGYLIKVRSYINANELARAQGITPADFDKVIIYEDHDKLCPRRNVRPGNHAGAQLQSRLL